MQRRKVPPAAQIRTASLPAHPGYSAIRWICSIWPEKPCPLYYLPKIPDDLYEALRARARRNRTSISAELLKLLANNVAVPSECVSRTPPLQAPHRSSPTTWPSQANASAPRRCSNRRGGCARGAKPPVDSPRQSECSERIAPIDRLDPLRRLHGQHYLRAASMCGTSSYSAGEPPLT